MTDQEKIERYLSEEMSPSERQAFEERLEREPDLAESLSLYQATREFFQQRNPALESTLSDLGQRYITDTPWYRRWWLGALFGLAALGGIYYAWSISPERQAVPATVSPTTEDASDIDTAGLISVPPTPQELPAAPATDQPQQTDDRQTDDDNGPSQNPPPIAQATPADYAPNPDLEELLNTMVRNADFFTVDSPGRTTTLSSTQTTWQLSARTTITEALELRLYTNITDDFYEDRRVLTQILQATGASDTLRLLENFATPEQAGLYYWLILDSETEELKAAGKIIVE